MPNKAIFLRVFLAVVGCFANASLGVFAQSLPESPGLFRQENAVALKDSELLLKDLIESIAESFGEDADISELSERLAHYHKHPIELNSTSSAVLKELFFLSPLQIAAFFNHLNVNGPLLDLLELQSIDGFDVVTVQRMMAFAYLKPATALKGISIKNLVSKSDNDLMLRYSQLLQKRKGFKTLPGSRYLGSAEKLLLRYRYTYTDLLSIGLVMEKDPGERPFNSKTVSDHLSGSLGLYQLGPIKKLVVGDYSMQFGQGLSLWSGFAFGKGPDVTSVAAKDTGIKPYSSSNESSFFRGVASTIKLNHIDLSTFVSYRKLDASLKTLPDGSSTLSNINISGLHRTATELKNQRSLSQAIYGGALQYIDGQLSIGTLLYHSRYNHPFSTGNSAYNRYGFTGPQLTNMGVHYQYTFRNYYLYGETAHSLQSGWAFIQGAMASLSSKLSAVLVYRKYEKDYHTFFGQAIGESTEVNNEEGWYVGINVLLSRRWTYSLYADYFQFPWLKYRVDAASRGYEWLSQLNFTPHKRFKALARFKTERKQQNPDTGSKNTDLAAVVKETWRLECNWSPGRKIHLQSRGECSSYRKRDNKVEYGLLLYQDCAYKPMSSRFSANFRLAWFSTPSYNSRIYAYEDDVLYGASSGIYYGKGLRSFINIRYQLKRHFDVWGRYSMSIYHNQETIGSGLDEINGNKKTEVKLQLRCQF